MKLFKIRLKACWDILTQKKKHWVLFSVSEEELINLITEGDIEIDISYHKLQKYNHIKLVQAYLSGFDEVDILQEKLRFEWEAEQFAKSKKQRNVE